MSKPAIPDETFYLSHPGIKDLQPGDEFTIKARVKTVHSTESVESDREHCSIDAEIISVNGSNVSKESKPKKSRDDEFDEEMDKSIEEEKSKKKDDEDYED